MMIYKNFFSNHDFFLKNFFKSFINRKEPELEPEPQFVISAPAPGGQFNFDSSALGSATLIHCANHHKKLRRKNMGEKSAHLRHGARCNKISVVAHSQGRIRQPQTGKIRIRSDINWSTKFFKEDWATGG